MVKSIDEAKLRVYVEPAQKGMIPFWLCSSRVTSRSLSEEIYNVLCEEEEYYFVNSKEVALLNKERRKNKKLGFEKGKLVIEQEDNIVKMHSYAGDRINLTLGLVLKNETGADKFSSSYKEIKLFYYNNNSKYKKMVKEFLTMLREGKLLLTSRFLRTIIEELPIKKVSKYYDYLPPLLQKEIIEEIYIDITGSIDFLQNKEMVYVSQDV